MGLRRATRADLPQLTELWLALTRHHAALDPLFELRPGAPAEARRLLEAWLGERHTAAFVLDEGAALSGFAIVGVSDAPPIHAETRRAEIHDLFVAPGARRRGQGRALVEAAVAWAREQGVERVEVRVLGRNREGRAFWSALDFGPHMDVLHRRL